MSWTREQWRECAEALWGILDDIDTLSDMLKPNDEDGYRKFCSMALKRADKRHLLLHSDGYKLTPPGASEEPAEEAATCVNHGAPMGCGGTGLPCRSAEEAARADCMAYLTSPEPEAREDEHYPGYPDDIIVVNAKDFASAARLAALESDLRALAGVVDNAVCAIIDTVNSGRIDAIDLPERMEEMHDDAKAARRIADAAEKIP